MAVAIIGPKFYAWDRNGQPLAFGKVFTYQARTNNPKPTYQSEDQLVENTNPVILNGEGYADIYLDGSYKIVVKDSDDNEIWTSDPVTANQANEWVSCVSASYISPSSFEVSGNLTGTYSVGRRIRVDNGSSNYAYTSVASSVLTGDKTVVTTTSSVVSTGIVSSCASILTPDGLQETTVDSVAAMKLLSLSVGSSVKTLGYYQPGDGGDGNYLISDPSSVDGYGDHLIANGNSAIIQGDFLSCLQFGVKFDGATDDSEAWQAISSRGGSFDARVSGVTVIDTVSVTKSLEFYCSEGTTFKRKDGSDGAGESYWNQGAAMFEIDADGVDFSIHGAFTYDGNNANQTSTEPTGWFLKTYPQASPIGDDTQIYLQKGEFFNGTSGYLLLRGDDFNKRYETVVVLDDCVFHETVYGKGKGDPSTPTALGYSPTMVLVLDYVRLYAKNFTADWEKTTNTGQYAACAINGTFFGVDYNLSGESHVYLHGTTRITGLGRSAKKWDDDGDWVTNNGIGAIDMYGNAHTLYVENVVAVDCENVPVRAKSSLKNYIVMSATLTNCHRGLQVGPSSTGDPETVCYVGTVTSEGGTIPQLEFVGNLPTATVRSVHIDHASSYGTKTNPENLANEAVFRFRNCSKVTASSLFVAAAPLRGVYVADCNRLSIDSLLVNTAGVEGILTQGCDLVKINAVDIRNTLGAAVSLAGVIQNVLIGGGFIDNAVNYGVFGNFTGRMDVSSVKIENLTGTDRAVYFAANTKGSVVGCESGSANPVFAAAGALYSERDNSWNPVEFWGTAAPASGTYRVGDRVWDSTPASAGKMGWVCTAAGSPGTWKPFGAIDA